jgi:menaquinone-specific isochorismate synthase
LKPLQIETFLPNRPSLYSYEETPSKQQWTQDIKKTLLEIEKGTFSKAVLSKRTTFSYNEETPFFSFVEQLKKENPKTSTFAIQIDPSSLFLGSSPERLYQRKESTLITEAIAGTRKRSADPLEDLSYSQELKNSAKDQKEVLYVKEFLEKKLSPFCLSLSATNNHKVIQTKTLWHLRYPFEGILHPGTTDYDLLSTLHPTPAVNGTPKEAALSWIHDIEKHARGLYSGSIGWTSPLEGAFTVAIRSALIRDKQLHAFSGAGIVSGSNAFSEWEELEHKISHWNPICSTQEILH